MPAVRTYLRSFPVKVEDNVVMRNHLYASDVSREQFEQIQPLLESVRKRTKPRSVDQVGAARTRQGRNACMMCLIVDAQSVKIYRYGEPEGV